MNYSPESKVFSLVQGMIANFVNLVVCTCSIHLRFACGSNCTILLQYALVLTIANIHAVKMKGENQGDFSTYTCTVCDGTSLLHAN